MFSLVRAILFAVALAFLPTAAGAQTVVQPFDEREQTTSVGSTVITGAIPACTMDVKITAMALTGVPRDARLRPFRQSQAPSQRRRKDSLWNGVLVGAGVGAVLGAFVGNAILDCSECSGFNVPLTFGVLGAGVGAGIGAGVDALRHAHSTITSPPHRTRRVRLSPLLTKKVRGMVAWIRL